MVEAGFGPETFRANGHRPLAPGWKVLYPVKGKARAETDDAEPEQTLPAIVQGETAHKLDVEAREKQTTPPKAYTDGTLISDMESVHRVVAAKTNQIDNKWLKLLKENAGLGTEATRARIIAVLLERNFLARDGKLLVSTATGRSLIQALPKEVKSPIATAMMEQELAAIEQEGRDSTEFLHKQQENLVRLVALAAATPIRLPPAMTGVPARKKTAAQSKTATGVKAAKKTTAKPRKGSTRKAAAPAAAPAGAHADSGKTCPACGKPMVLRHRKTDGQAFYGCSGYPGCRKVVEAD